MNSILSLRGITLVGVAAVTLCSRAEGAIVVTFDDLYGGYGGLIPSAYAGLAWGPDWALYEQAIYQGPYGNSYGPPSSPNLAFPTGLALERVVSNPTPFNFIGAEVSTFSYNDAFYSWSSTSITVDGYRNNVWVGSVTMTLGVGFQHLAANFNAIDTLVFTNDGIPGHPWVLDNFTYSVPEPPVTATLSGLSLLGLAAWRRARR